MKKVKLLHIVPDDKFTDTAIDLFDATFAENRYVYLSETIDGPFKYIKKESSVERVEIKKAGLLWEDSLVDMFCFHSLDYSEYMYVLSIPLSKKILWLSWGYDLYPLYFGWPSVICLNCLKPLTSRLLKYKSWKTYGKEVIKFLSNITENIANILKEKHLAKERIDIQRLILERVDYISTVLPIEYEMIKRQYDIHARYFPFQYVRKENYNTFFMLPNADMLLIGNSASPTNNHFDILDLLEKRKIFDKLYVPIAYGDAYYAHSLRSKVDSMALGTRVTFQTNFLDYTQYKTLLSNFKAFIIGAVRQQAMGNICIMMNQGSKIYLYKDSVMYQFFKKEGFVVFSIEDDLYEENLNVPMTREEIDINRVKINNLLGYDNVLSRVNKALQEIADEVD